MKMISSSCPKLVFLFIALLILPTTISAQGWERIYENNPNPAMGYSFAEAGNVHQLADGTYQVITAVDGISQLFLLDDQGYKLSSNTIPPTGNLGYKQFVKATDDNFVYTQGTNVTKFDASGNILWDHSFGNLNWTESITDLIQNDDGDYLITGGANTQGGYVLKLNENGDELWKTYTNIDDNIYKFDVAALNDGGYIVGCDGQYTSSTFNTYLTKLDNNGNILWQFQPIDNPSDISGFLPQSDGFITFGTSVDLQNFWTQKGSVVKYDNNGNLLWAKTIDNFDWQNAVKIIETSDGGFALLMNGGNSSSGNSPKIVIVKLDSNGDQEWFEEYGLATPLQNYGADIQQANDGGFVVCGYVSDGGENADIYIIKTDENGVSVSNLINGYVKFDTNENCELDNNEDPLDGWIVSAAGNQVTFYAVTDSSGYYQMEVDEGTFEVRAAMPSPYWSGCVDSTVVQLNTVYDTATVLIPIQAIEQCPLMEVHLYGLDVRVCEDNEVRVQCQNIGTDLAEDVTVDITFDDFFQLVNVSNNVSLINQVDNTFTFEVGDVDYLEEVNFFVQLQHDCDTTVIGQTFCAEALIFPDSTCLPINPLWSGAELDLRASCEGNEVIMTIENVGAGDMISELNYVIVEDDVIMSVEPFGPLPSGEFINMPRAANGSFQRIETPQEPFHPIGNMPVAFVEGCGENGNGEISLGFVNQYSLGDASPFEDVHCMEVVASFDPNEKAAYPIGYQAEHFIEKNTTLTYALHFQNIGTAPAYRVVITDALTEYLDPTSIQLGASSHPFSFNMYGTGVMEFTFDNIVLPDSASNPAGSQGFVEFKIDQMPDLPIGTKIFNEANIYFDANAAIRTNMTMHTIGENFITVNVEEITVPNVEVNVFPNPFQTSVTFEIANDDGFYNEELTFELYDMLGRKLIAKNFDHGTFVLDRGNLSSGTYFYTILTNDGLLNSGKVVVQLK